ncbi:MAG: hypothetical protein HYY16_12950 [Planctomycetes bacterium]|nr:hypothetical protein [Planctomycetota bacterium]
MDWIEIVYLVSFFLGLGFAIMSGLLSGVFSGHAEVAGDVDVSGGNIDAGGHAIGHGESVPLSPVSPVTIAMFVATFGGTGIILKKYFLLPAFAHIPIAAVSGFVVAALVFLLFYKIMSVTVASSAPRSDEAVGLEAEIITGIPAQGVGEIAYVLRESRFTAPAKTADGKELPARALVKIVKVVGGTFIVERSK